MILMEIEELQDAQCGSNWYNGISEIQPGDMMPLCIDV
jgi:hypothetical protein